MVSMLNEKDRALVDEAVAAGRVQKIPMGLCGVPFDITFKQSHTIFVSNTVHRSHIRNKMRKEKVIRMLNNGVDIRVIAKSMRISMENMWKIINNNRDKISTIVGSDT